MKKFIEFPSVFLIGGILYCLIEILWRGYTHWTMGIAGGMCFSAIYFLRKHCCNVPLWIRCVTGAVVICTVEYAAGFIVNILLGWNVWDYSDRLFNIYGQICPLYAVLWFFICIPGNVISQKIETLLFCKNNSGFRIDEKEASE